MRSKICAVGTVAPRMRRLLGLAPVVLAVCLLTACGGASAKPAITPTRPVGPPGSIPIGFFAVNDSNPAESPALSYGTMGHPVPFAWENIEQQSGNFDFTLYDGFAKIAPKDASGTALMVLTLGLTPPWALLTTDTSSCRTSATGAIGCTAPPNPQDWTNFVTTLINHYNGTTAPHIKYYEIWNEANQAQSWTGTLAQMEQLAAAAYPIIKQDGNSLVVGPSLTGNVHSSGPGQPIDWLASYLSAGGSSFMDVASFHGFVYSDNQVPYPLPTTDCGAGDPNCGGSIMAQVNAYRSVLDGAGMTSTPLFNTEAGFEGATIDLDTGAAWLAQYYALQAGMYNNDGLQLVSWFAWGTDDGQLDNGPNLTEVGAAYNQVSNWLVARTLASPCSSSGTIWTCTITGTNGYQAEIIWDASKSCLAGICATSNQPVAGIFIDYQDLAGNSTTISNQTAPVGLKPILLEN
jgi:hypothetical protein